MADDLEVLVPDTAEVVILNVADDLEVLLSSEEIQVYVNNDEDFVITASATSLTALNIALYARFAIFIESNPTGNELIVRFEMTDQLVFPTNFVASRGSAETGATNDAVFSIKKNGTEVATATFLAGEDFAIFEGTGATFNVGDILTVYAPPVQDATLANVSLTLAAQRVV